MTYGLTLTLLITNNSDSDICFILIDHIIPIIILNVVGILHALVFIDFVLSAEAMLVQFLTSCHIFSL